MQMDMPPLSVMPVRCSTFAPWKRETPNERCQCSSRNFSNAVYLLAETSPSSLTRCFTTEKFYYDMMRLDRGFLDHIESKLDEATTCGSAACRFTSEGSVQEMVVEWDARIAGIALQPSIGYDVHRNEAASNTMRLDELLRCALSLRH